MIESGSVSTPILDRKMIAGLQALYEVVSHDWNDARGECLKVSEQVAREFGLSYAEGAFRLDKPLGFGTDNLLREHAWCVDGNRAIVDLTAEQFNPGLVRKIPKGVLVVRKEEELYGRYKTEFIRNRR